MIPRWLKNKLNPWALGIIAVFAIIAYVLDPPKPEPETPPPIVQDAPQPPAAPKAAQTPTPKARAVPEAVSMLDKSVFRIRCRNAITEQLKSPSTAKFEGIIEQDAQTQTGPNGYFWPGRVDSQNGFGAMIRSRFKCAWNQKTQTLTAELLP